MQIRRTIYQAGGKCREAGLTLVEVISGAAVLAMAIVSLLMALISQVTLNEHSRNLAWASNDASRVLEQLQGQNGAGVCAAINVAPPNDSDGNPFASWNAWLGASTATGGAGGKSVPPNPATEELVVITPAAPTGADPLEVTITVCWRHRQRVIGECAWNGAQLTASDLDGNGQITSPAMLSTFVTCRG